MILIIVLISDYKDGFGGQFGVQADRVDKSALGWEHHEKLNKHESQKDYAKGKEITQNLKLDLSRKVFSICSHLQISQRNDCSFFI